MNLKELSFAAISRWRSQGRSSLLGLAFEGSRMEGVWLRRSNGSLRVEKRLSSSLALDLATSEPELIGREIRKHLDQAGVRERRCVVCVPSNWALTLQTKLPELSEADQQSFLQIEAERGFPYSPEALIVASTRFRTPSGDAYATLVGVLRDHLTRLERALRAAQCRPLSFSVGLAELQRASAPAGEWVMGLVPVESRVGLEISSGGSVAVLRTIEGAFELENSQPQLQVEPVARELRITLGRLPADVRAALRQVRVFGESDAAQELAEELSGRVQSMGLSVQLIRTHRADEFTVPVIGEHGVSPALCLAARHLAGERAILEFLPPKVSGWQQFNQRYASRKLVWAGASAGALVLAAGAAFLFQEWQLSRWGSIWETMSPRVAQVQAVQNQVKQFRPWFDESFRTLTILRRLTEAFPEDGAVTAKTIEINDAGVITCKGSARDHQILLRTLEKLQSERNIDKVQLEQIRGKSPMQFTFNFQWMEGKAP